jgi:glucose/arabinose dehydrogenase
MLPPMPHRTLSLTALAAAVALVACGTNDVRARTQTTAAGHGVRLVQVGSFDQPLWVTSPPRDRRRLFIVEQAGRIRILERGRKLATPFLDIHDQVTSGGEQGMLGLAFAPDYATSGLFYVYFTGRDSREHLVEFHRASRDRADPGSERTVFVHDDPEANHNGGMLVFGADGHLYVGTGDGGGANDQHGTIGNAQDLRSPLGKILRIDPRAKGASPFTVPASNPFVGRPGARPEVYAYGLRNPWRFSFDRVRGDLIIGDVGQDAVEEIDFVPRDRRAGRNFGWRPFEGTTRLFDEPTPGAVPPVITKTHAEGWCSITGGYVVRDRAVPGLYGRYVYGDFCKGELRSARLAPGRATDDRPIPGLAPVSGLDSFGEDADGRVYVISTSGPVYRFAAR